MTDHEIAKLQDRLAELKAVDLSTLNESERRRHNDQELNLRAQINMHRRASGRSPKLERLRQLAQERLETVETDQSKAQSLTGPFGRLDRLGYDCRERAGRFTVTDRRTGERVGRSMDAGELLAWAASFASGT